MRHPQTLPQHSISTRPRLSSLFRRSRFNGTYDKMANVPIEEQTLSQYRKKQYLPVQMGDLFKDQYRVLAKLGYGAYSTVWLARDEASNRYATLKMCINDERETSPILNEVRMLRHLAKMAAKEDEERPGKQYTRLARVDGPSGRHFCIVIDPQGTILRSLQVAMPNASMPIHMIITARCQMGYSPLPSMIGPLLSM